jgi:hypothetical protein
LKQAKNMSIWAALCSGQESAPGVVDRAHSGVHLVSLMRLENLRGATRDEPPHPPTTAQTAKMIPILPVSGHGTACG